MPAKPKTIEPAPAMPVTQDLYAERERLLAFLDNETLRAVEAGEERPGYDLRGLARQAGLTEQDLDQHFTRAKSVIKHRAAAGTLADLERDRAALVEAEREKARRSPAIEAEIMRLQAEAGGLETKARLAAAAVLRREEARRQLRASAPAWVTERHGFMTRRIGEEFRPLQLLEARLKTIAGAQALAAEEHQKLHLEGTLLDPDLAPETLAAARQALRSEVRASGSPRGPAVERGGIQRGARPEGESVLTYMRQWVDPVAWEAYLECLRVEAEEITPKVEELRKARAQALEEAAGVLDHYLND